MRVVVLQRIDTRRCAERDQVERVERPQSRQVEDRAEVDEERIVTLAGKHLAATRQRGDCGRCKRVVVRRRARADVVGRRRCVVHEHDRLVLAALLDLAVLLEVDERDAVGLRAVPVRVAERRDRARVVEERVRVPRRRREAELVADVVLTVTRVVDLDLVEHGVVEAREVRPAGRSLERDVVRDERDLARVVRTDERVQVGVVGARVLADQRRLRVTRSAGCRRPMADEHAATAAVTTATTNPSNAIPLLICAPFPNV